MWIYTQLHTKAITTTQAWERDCGGASCGFSSSRSGCLPAARQRFLHTFLKKNPLAPSSSSHTHTALPPLPRKDLSDFTKTVPIFDMLTGQKPKQ